MGRRELVLFLFCMVRQLAIGQELEPRAYSALPKNLNTFVFVYAFSNGNVVTDPALPISGFTISMHSLTAGYMRTFELAGKLARVQVSIPVARMTGQLQINGRDTSGFRGGFGDTRVRLGINLTGT